MREEIYYFGKGTVYFGPKLNINSPPFHDFIMFQERDTLFTRIKISRIRDHHQDITQIGVSGSTKMNMTESDNSSCVSGIVDFIPHTSLNRFVSVNGIPVAPAPDWPGSLIQHFNA